MYVLEHDRERQILCDSTYTRSLEWSSSWRQRRAETTELEGPGSYYLMGTEFWLGKMKKVLPKIWHSGNAYTPLWMYLMSLS